MDMSDYYGLNRAILTYPLQLIIRFLVIVKLLQVTDFNDFKKNDSYVQLILNKQFLLVKGWCFRAHHLTKKYQSYFIHKYSLQPEFYQNNDLYRTLSKINRSYHQLVGIHIRRGDYRYWANGKYYFDDDTYLKYMRNISIELKNFFDKKLLFILFSDETINIKRADNIIISKNEWFIDQLLMSKCDFLIGPPSSFTLWASYIGKVKFFHIKDNTGQIKINDFSYCEG